MKPLPDLSITEWVVLAILVESPQHGFAVAAVTGNDGDLGRVWHVPRPVVYRALSRLVEQDLARPSATEPGERGPNRRILRATDDGHQAVRDWLRLPVEHIREVRSELLAKLALIDRRRESPSSLLAAQRAVFEPMATALRSKLSSERGFDRTVSALRYQNVEAALRFLSDPIVVDPHATD